MLVLLDRMRDPAGEAGEGEEQLAGASRQRQHVRERRDAEVHVRSGEATLPRRLEKRLDLREPLRLAAGHADEIEERGRARIAAGIERVSDAGEAGPDPRSPSAQVVA